MTALPIDVGSRTDMGRVRENNEDAFLVVAPLELFIVSDGMGGEAHGEVASAIAVETIAEHCQSGGADSSAPLFGEPRPELSARTNRLASAVHLANSRIYEASERDPGRRGMGATVVAAWLDGLKLSLVHVGDSRVYLLRAGALVQLTADHSLVAEQVRRGFISPQQAESSELQNVLTRALGPHVEIELDAAEHILKPGDTLILCTDGLTRMVSDEEIASTLLTTTGAQAAADRLIELGNENGGVDNITVIIVSIPTEHDGLLDKLKLWRRD
ncbi:MAG: Stp1/IreP family PP2C-type Ser/Thr phosphatase [Candidatus Acidiferrales bacterium]